MLTRVIVTAHPGESLSQGTWDDFCHAQGLTLSPTGYFRQGGMRAGCQGARASFFGLDPAAVSALAGEFLIRFGGQAVVQVSPRVRIPVGAR